MKSQIIYENRYTKRGICLPRVARLALLALAMSANHQLEANPLNGQVTAGSATINTPNPSTTLINQSSARAVLRWSDFSNQRGEIIRFVQPGSDSAALNLVRSGIPSQINGIVEANGNVWLMNPAGVAVGPSGRIDTAGFLATTLQVDPDKFMKNSAQQLSGNSDQAIVNQGSIHTTGDTVLIGARVINEGVIEAGRAGLASGSRVEFNAFDRRKPGMEFISVVTGPIEASSSGVENRETGIIRAAASELRAAGGNPFAVVIDNAGVVEAENGGSIEIAAEAGGVSNSGTLDASSRDGQGGKIHVLGDQVAIESGSRIDSSGSHGGGEILVGGDFQGANPEIKNAANTKVATGAELRADADGAGDGGKVIVWADDRTEFAGSISARGGATSGDGGNAEVSGKNALAYQGTVDLRAPNGDTGKLLLDPKNISIADGGADPVAGNSQFGENPASDVTISPASVVAALSMANLELQANNDINVNSAVDSSANVDTHDLSLTAGRNVNINADLTIAGNLLVAADQTAQADPAQRDAGTGQINIGNGVRNISTTRSVVQNGFAGQRYTGKVQLNNDTTMSVPAGSTLLFDNAVEGPGGLQAVSPTVLFLGEVGVDTPLKHYLASNSLTFVSGRIRTSGEQVYAQIQLLTNATLTSVGNSNIVFLNTVDSSPARSDNFGLTIETGGTNIVNGAIGGIKPLAYFTNSAAHVVLAADVRTASNQVYAGAIVLDHNAVDLITTNGGLIVLNGTVDGANGLRLSNPGGTNIIAAAVGGRTALRAFTNQAARIEIGGGTVNTLRNQNYDGNIVLTADTVFTTEKGTATNPNAGAEFDLQNSPLDAGGNALTLDVGRAVLYADNLMNLGAFTTRGGKSGSFTLLSRSQLSPNSAFSLAADSIDIGNTLAVFGDSSFTANAFSLRSDGQLTGPPGQTEGLNMSVRVPAGGLSLAPGASITSVLAFNPVIGDDAPTSFRRTVGVATQQEAPKYHINLTKAQTVTLQPTEQEVELVEESVAAQTNYTIFAYLPRVGLKQ